MKVLIIDDDEHIRVLAEWVFSKEGDRVSVAGSGGDGLALVGVFRPDVVLLDFYLEDMSGADVLAALRGDAETCGIPVILLTAREVEQEERETALEGALGVIPKPFDPTRLRETVRTLVSGH